MSRILGSLVKSFTGLALVLSAFVFLFGCTKKSPTGVAESQEVASALVETKELNLAIWGNYISDDLVKKFESETGIKVTMTHYSSNEELLAKIQMGSSGIDMAVPSDYMVDIMAKMGLLEKLNKSLLPNFSLLDTQFLGQDFDKQNDYSIPYIWTTTGIAYNKNLLKGSITSWKEFFEKSELKGKSAVLDDVREVMAAAHKANGFSVNSLSKEEIQKSKETLLKAKGQFKMFASDTIDILTNKEVIAAQAYSSDALQAAAKSKGQIEFVIPTEGGTRAIDNMVFLKGAKNLWAAHKLANFLLTEEADRSRVQNIFGGPVLAATKKSLPADVQKNAALFPSTETMQKLEALQDLGDGNQAYEDAWTEIKTN